MIRRNEIANDSSKAVQSFCLVQTYRFCLPRLELNDYPKSELICLCSSLADCNRLVEKSKINDLMMNMK